MLHDAFQRGGRSTRLRVLLDLERMFPDALGIAKTALGDDDACVRLEAARILKDPKVMLDVLRDKSSMTGTSGLVARIAAVGHLSSGFDLVGDETVTGRALRERMMDPTEDVRVRQFAAFGLGNMGFQDAVPDLLVILKSPPIEKPVYLQEEVSLGEYLSGDDVRLGAVNALGALREPTASRFLREYLSRRPLRYDSNLRAEMALALVRIEGVQARRFLEKRNGSERWENAARLLRAIDERDVLSVMASGSPRASSRLLADTFTREELERALADEPIGQVQKLCLLAALKRLE
jgi:HEAT repeat protein